MKHVFSFFIAIVITGCTNNQPDYLNKIAELDDVEYKTFDIQQAKWGDTLEVSPWLNPEDARQVAIQHLGDMTSFGVGYMISDWARGNIFRVDKHAQLIDTLAKKGKGPGDFMNPAAISRFITTEDTLYYVLDTGLNLLKKINSSGDIKEAWGHTSLPHSSWLNQLSITKKHVFWATQHIKENVLIKAQLDGKVVGRTIDRLIPLGKQPYTYNSIVFDISMDETEMVFAYSGLPIIFYHNKETKTAINLQPKKEIEDLNTPLEIMSENERVTVENLVRAVYLLSDDKLLVNYNSKIITLRTDGSRGRVNSLVANGEVVKFHKMIKVETYLFMINLFSGEIYRLELNKITK